MRTVVEYWGFSLAKKRADGTNEDYFEMQPNEPTGPADWTDFAAVVADGVGSSGAPAEASKAAAQSWMLHTRAKFLENVSRCAGFGDLHFNEITSHAYLQAHEAVLQTSKGSACAVSLCVQGDRLILGNVGDCRVYRINAKGVEQLSRDQLDSQGDPTQVIGGRRPPEAYAATSRVQAGDVLVLCSDGVWKLIEPAQLKKAAAGKGAKEIALRLKTVLESIRGPESDDATAVIAQIVKIGKPFWEADSKDMDSGIKNDPIETKLNAVLAELLNRLRTPLEKENAQMELVLDQLTNTVRDLKVHVGGLGEVIDGAAARRGRPRGSYVPVGTLLGAIIGSVLLTGMVSWAILGRTPSFETYELKPVLPKDARVVTQQYTNDALQVRFLDADGKPKLAVYKAKDEGRPSVIVDLSPAEKPKPTAEPNNDDTSSPK